MENFFLVSEKDTSFFLLNMSADKRTVITVGAKTHKKLKIEAARRGISVRQITDLLLSFGLDKLKAGVIQVTNPTVEGAE
jgi:hypothetical protein